MKTFFQIAILIAAAMHTRESIGQQEIAPGVLLVGRIQNTNITESSGVVPSHRGKAFWTHNDGDNKIFAITREGRSLGKWNVNAHTEDFEDIAWSPGRLYIADIGNNLLTRSNVFVYAVPEPGPTFSGSLPIKARWRLRYAEDVRFDAESLLVHRRNGYVIAKELINGAARVYHFPLRARGGAFTLEPQCELNVAEPVSGADLSRDARHLAVITRKGAYLFDVQDGLPATGRLEPTLFVPFELDRMEGCCFTPDGLLVTAETGELLLFDNPQFVLGR
jgi:hypothetical protein